MKLAATTASWSPVCMIRYCGQTFAVTVCRMESVSMTRMTLIKCDNAVKVERS
jgi:hypothetical protein